MKYEIIRVKKKKNPPIRTQLKNVKHRNVRIVHDKETNAKRNFVLQIYWLWQARLNYWLGLFRKKKSPSPANAIQIRAPRTDEYYVRRVRKRECLPNVSADSSLTFYYPFRETFTIASSPHRIPRVPVQVNWIRVGYENPRRHRRGTFRRCVPPKTFDNAGGPVVPAAAGQRSRRPFHLDPHNVITRRHNNILISCIGACI